MGGGVSDLDRSFEISRRILPLDLPTPQRPARNVTSAQDDGGGVSGLDRKHLDLTRDGMLVIRADRFRTRAESRRCLCPPPSVGRTRSSPATGERVKTRPTKAGRRAPKPVAWRHQAHPPHPSGAEKLRVRLHAGMRL